MVFKTNILEHWENEAKKVLLGKRIVAVQYLSDDDIMSFGWKKRPLCLKLDDGTELFISCNNEAEDGGSIMVVDGIILPTLD